MPKFTAIAAALFLSAAPVAYAQMQPDAKAAATQQKVDTATFLKTVMASNQFEIDSSKLAEEKAKAADVKAFAAQMIKDHTKAGEDFKAALDQSQTTSAVTPETGGKEADMLKLLQGLSGDEFQARYVAMQATAHKDAVALFRNYSQNGDDPALKEFAKKTLPMLQEHERMVKDLQAAVGQ
jgi:putative membrane protein